MAINSFEETCNKIDSKYSSNNSKVNNLHSSHMLKLSIAADDNLSISEKSSKSPYLSGDNVQMMSRVTEKRLVHKKATNIVSSYPLAVNIYKASSDEFKSHKKAMKKMKKSVLTLPNVPATIPQTCTVSDMNDSEYFNSSTDNKKTKTKKKFTAQNRKPKPRNKGYEFYDRDARFCSQMNINLDCSSTDVINNFTGDGKSISHKYFSLDKPLQNENEFSAHDVWAVLHNINRFQFRPSPPVSNESVQSPKKKKLRNRRKNNRKDTRVVETCRTEEFAYSIEVDTKSPQSVSLSSSFDRITVIDKGDGFDKLCKELKKSIVEAENSKKSRNGMNTNQNKKVPKNKLKSILNRDCNNQPELVHKNKIDNNYNKTVCAFKENNNGKEYINQPDLEKNNLDNISNKKICALKTNNNNIVDTMYRRQVVVAKLGAIVSQINKDNDCSDIKSRENNNKVDNYNEKTCTNFDRLDSSIKPDVRPTSQNRRDLNENIIKVSSNESQQVNGITKVILKKGQDYNDMNRNGLQKRIPLFGSATSNKLTDSGFPKFTQTEIKRRLANLKFPIIILGKDQIGTSTWQVKKYEAPQFDGLDQHIWPFMQSWYNTAENGPINNCVTNNLANAARKLYCNETNGKQVDVLKMPPNFLRDKSANCGAVSNKKKYHHKPLPPSELSKIKLEHPQKAKPIQQFKDKMLKLLYKNMSVTKFDDNINSMAPLAELNVYEKSSNDASTETTTLNYDIVTLSLSKKQNTCQSPHVKKVPTVIKYPWAKGKWASEFIESVIKKLRSGIYYNNEHNNTVNSLINLKEVSVQTTLTGDINKVLKMPNEINFEDKDIKEPTVFIPEQEDMTIQALPGFDESPPALEVQTLGLKEISVKHCTTNVVVQFDVALPQLEDKNKMLSYSIIPLKITESNTKIFKCQTTLINAMLPAEICSILPKILRSITDSYRLPALPSYQNNSTLYTISELPQITNSDSGIVLCALPAAIGMSPTLSKLLKGVYRFCQQGKKVNNTKRHLGLLKSTAIKEINCILPTLDVTKIILSWEVQPDHHIMLKPRTVPKSFTLSLQKVNGLTSCTALQLYRPPKPVQIHETHCFNVNHCKLTNLFKQLWDDDLSVRFKMSMPLSISFANNNIVNVEINQGINITKIFSNIISNDTIDSLFDGTSNQAKMKSFPLKAIEYKSSSQEKSTRKDSPSLLSVKTRKKSFVKLYKKCKSTSNIPGEKTSTPLSKITNLDEFFQALGSGKTLSNVFDGQVGKKLMSAVSEMKNWITEISPRQAMLLLLLTNKKTTHNLVRYRVVILQGIAVNRITRASELDMEIEVIERENLNKFSQYEGPSCFPEIVENRDSLLEELYWIAKTTASDYQKPFNESSEKLLKSLLEKRKKLNPSYLRVMARYVGLGLLTSPKKYQNA